MFRFVSANARQSLRPVLLQNLGNNSGIIAPPPVPFTTPANGYSKFQRFNSYAANVSQPSKEHIEDYVSKLQEDPLVGKAIRDEAQIKLNYFKEQVVLFDQYKKLSDVEGRRAFSETFHNILNSFEDNELRSIFSTHDLRRYVAALNFSIYHNRTSRLASNKNVDRDQYSSSTSIDEVLLKKALLRFNDVLMKGELKNILNADSLVLYFNAMNQFQFYTESIDAWEQGVNDNKIGGIYLSEKVLSVVLPIAQKIERFSYEEICRIYELNTAKASDISPQLICSMGKISIAAGDYKKGLDFLESLLKYFEERKHNPSNANYYLGDLHLSFIGSCDDVVVAKHFFDKVINYDLPYMVKLKVPYVQKLMENCHKNNESLDTILYFWKATVHHYATDKRAVEINSRYSNLNNTMFKIFFKFYPELTTESFGKLKEIISDFNSIKPVDEIFLNTLITNYAWKDKVVFNQLIDNYTVFGINRTQVSYRVCLKKIGEIKGFTHEEISQKWSESLESLDEKRFKYIPNADWASIRDATIWSKEERDERIDLYWQIVHQYKNFMQDKSTCIRFVRNWMKNEHGYEDLKNHVVNGKDSELQTPNFKNLKRSVNFDQVFADTTNRK